MAQNPVVTIEMENGDKIKAELYPEIAPNTVNNFIINGFMIQGGCPEGSGMGGPGYSIKGEFSENGFENDLKHTEGVLSMARSMAPDSAGSQFFIMHKTSPHLDGAYAAFGKVIEGMEVVNRIAETNTDYSDRPLEDQVIRSAWNIPNLRNSKEFLRLYADFESRFQVSGQDTAQIVFALFL